MKLQDLRLGLGIRVNESHGHKKVNRIFQKTTSNKLFPGKAIAIKIVLSKTARFYFEHIIIMIIIIIITIIIIIMVY